MARTLLGYCCSNNCYWSSSSKRQLKLYVRTDQNESKEEQEQILETYRAAIGSINMRISRQELFSITEWIDILNIDVSILIVFYFLVKYKIYVRNLLIRLEYEELHMRIPVLCKRGNIFLEWYNYDKIIWPRHELFNFYQNLPIVHLISF